MPSERPAPYRLTLLGPWDLRGPDGEKVRSVLSQPKRLCLLAHLALVGEPVSRSTLVAMFWPESDEERARNALSQALHYLRRSLGPGVVESVEGDRIVVLPEKVWFDARVLLEWARDGAEGAGPEVMEVAEPVLRGREFFQGWNADDSQPLQEWLDGVRRRVREGGEEVRRSRGSADSVDDEVESDDGREDPKQSNDDALSETVSEETVPTGIHVSASTGPPRRAAWAVVGLVGGLLLALGSGLLAPGGDATGGASPDPVADGPGAAVGDRLATSAEDDDPDGRLPAVAVLLPRVTVLGEGGTDGPSARALADAVHEELVAEMWHLSGVEIVPVGFESDVWRLVRTLEAQGADHVPDWVVTVGIRSGGGSARVVAQLRSGPGYGEVRGVSEGDYPVPDAAAGLVGLPRRIAEDVVRKLTEDIGALWEPSGPGPAVRY